MEGTDRGAGAQDNRGREGDGRRKGGERDLYEGGKRERNSKRQAFVIYYCLSSSQKHKPSNVFDFHLTFSESSNKILYARKHKFVLGLKNRISFGENNRKRTTEGIQKTQTGTSVYSGRKVEIQK